MIQLVHFLALRKRVFIFIAYFLGLFLVGLALWTNRFFGYVTIDQALSTFYFGVGGLFVADSVYIKRFLVWCIFWPGVLAFFLTILNLKLSNRFLKFSSAPIMVAIIGVGLIFNQFSGFAYFKSLAGPRMDLFQENYKDPKLAQIFKKHKPLKSIVIIYVESLENTYSNEKIFGHDLLQSLNKFKNEDKGYSFSEYKQMPGTGWTMAAIVATQCGIPLKELTFLDGNRLGENIQQFLPNAVCLSDILAKFGYQNIYMNGASIKFAGKNKFLSGHHYSEIYGKEEWLQKGVPNVAMSDWGLSDHDLFEQAKVRLDDLMAKKSLFNLTILTVDTHGFGGRLNDYCKSKGFRDFSGIVECTAGETADFVQYIKDKGWLDRVNVIVIGDHLAMKNAVYDKLTLEPYRTIFNLIVSQDRIHQCSSEVIGFGWLPTMLKLSGFRVDGNRLGLGYGAIGHCHHAGPESYIGELEKNINNSSRVYARLWTQT